MTGGPLADPTTGMPDPAVPHKVHVDYGLDAPGVVRTMFFIGVTGLVGGLLMRYVYQGVVGDWWRPVLSTGENFIFFGSVMVFSSRFGKLRARDNLLDRLTIDPSASVLDVGCGHGLLLIGAAKRVPTGRAVGVDLWSQKDQGSNTADATRANAVAEGVGDRVDVRDGDARSLPFEDATFDVIVSSLVLHNISGREERRRAIKEIARVLKPGGQIGILDLRYVGQYAADLRAAGVRQVQTPGFTFWIFPPSRVLVARK